MSINFLKISLFFIIFIFAFSCNTKKVRIIEKEALEALIQDTVILNQNNETLYNGLRRKVDINTAKILPYYIIAYKIHSKSTELRNLLIAQNQQYNYKVIKDSINSYKTILQEASKLNLFHFDKSINPDSFFGYKELMPEQNQVFYKNNNPTILVNNIILAENRTIRALLNQTSHVDGPFSKIRLLVVDEEKPISKYHYFSAILIPTEIKDESKCRIQIDNIILEGKKIETRVRADWKNGIGRIKIYAPKEGNYQFTGRVLFKEEWGLNSVPFQGSFTVY